MPNIIDLDDRQKLPKDEVARLGNEIRTWVMESLDIFTIFDIDKTFELRTRFQKNIRSRQLNYLERLGKVKKVPGKRGVWKPVDTNIGCMDLNCAKPVPYGLPMVLGICDLVEIYPGNIITIGGTPNSGKTTFAINLALKISILLREQAKTIHTRFLKELDRYYRINNTKTELEKATNRIESGDALLPPSEIYYFNCEMGVNELVKVLNEYPCPNFMKDPESIKWVERDDNFEDVLRPNAINIIDYIENLDEFWKIGPKLKAIHGALKDGLAIICLQKKPGAEDPKGGAVTREKSRLSINFESNSPFGGIAKITKAKNWASGVNPNGLECDFKIKGGWRMDAISPWRYVDDKERKRINARYKNESSVRKEYAYDFEIKGGGIVGLKHKDVEKWKTAYPNIDVEKTLWGLVRESKIRPWMTKDNWFWQASNYLKKRNEFKTGQKQMEVV